MKVVLMVNSECNVQCKHCYLPYSGERTPEDTLRTVKQLQDNGHEVMIAGSETLLNPEYLKAYQQAGQDYLLTNGILLNQNPSLYDALKDHGIEKLGFSIHFGVQEDLKSVPENLVARVLKESKERGFITQVATTITSQNYQDVEEMCERSVEYGADMIQFLRFVQLGRGEQIGQNALTPEQIEEFFQQIDEAREKFPKSVLEIRPHGNFGPKPGSKGEAMARANNYCSAGKDLAAIDPENRVYGCPYSMGSVIGRFEDGEIVIDIDIEKRDTCIAHALG
jgi:MoaA/NifB/PqqE/SkfB family radical SAM enzyme